MKKIIFTLCCSVILFAAKISLGQSHPALLTGIYLIDNNSNHQLPLNDKVYGIDPQPVCNINGFKSAVVGQSLVKGKTIYTLNLKLNSTGTKSLSKIDVNYAQKKYIGLVIKGKLKSVAWLVSPITNGELSLTGTKQSVEDMQRELKSEIK